jgi:hypothetical protein
LVGDYTAIGISNDDPDVVKGGQVSYAVKDYYNVNLISPLIQQTGCEFEALIARTHKAEKLIMISYRTILHENMKEKQSRRSQGLWG